MEDQEKNQALQLSEEIEADYANNVFFVGTVWDIKLLFGELNAGTQGIDWHTSITLPWAQAKLMSYYLQLNIAAHEAEGGKIPIPASMIPPEAPAIAPSNKDKPTASSVGGADQQSPEAIHGKPVVGKRRSDQTRSRSVGGR